MNPEKGEPAAEGSGLLGVLLEPSQNGSYERDIRLVARAVAEGWPMEEPVRNEIIKRLSLVVARETVKVPCGEGGVFDSEAVADRNAVSAASVLRAMHADDRSVLIDAAKFGQAERFNAQKLAQDDKHLAVSWTDQLSKASPAELVDAAIRLDLVDKLPPALKELALAKMAT